MSLQTRQRSGPVSGSSYRKAKKRHVPRVSSLDTSLKRPTIVGLVVKPIGKPSAGNRHARFDERGWETERWPMAPSYRAHPRLYQSATHRETSTWSAAGGRAGAAAIRGRGEAARGQPIPGQATAPATCSVKRGLVISFDSCPVTPG